MPIIIKRSDQKKPTRIKCPDCGTKVESIGFKKDSKVEGVVFQCEKCKSYWKVTTE